MSSSCWVAPRCMYIPPRMLYIRTQLDTLGFTYDFDTSTSTPWALALCLPSSRIVTGKVGCLVSSHSLARRFPRISMCRRRRCSLYPHGLTYGATLRWPLRNPQSRSVPVLAGVSSASAPSPRRRQNPASEAQVLPGKVCRASLDFAGLW